MQMPEASSLLECSAALQQSELSCHVRQLLGNAYSNKTATCCVAWTIIFATTSLACLQTEKPVYWPPVKQTDEGLVIDVSAYQ